MITNKLLIHYRASKQGSWRDFMAKVENRIKLPVCTGYRKHRQRWKLQKHDHKQDRRQGTEEKPNYNRPQTSQTVLVWHNHTAMASFCVNNFLLRNKRHRLHRRLGDVGWFSQQDGRCCKCRTRVPALNMEPCRKMTERLWMSRRLSRHNKVFLILRGSEYDGRDFCSRQENLNIHAANIFAEGSGWRKRQECKKLYILLTSECNSTHLAFRYDVMFSLRIALMASLCPTLGPCICFHILITTSVHL